MDACPSGIEPVSPCSIEFDSVREPAGECSGEEREGRARAFGKGNMDLTKEQEKSVRFWKNWRGRAKIVTGVG